MISSRFPSHEVGDGGTARDFDDAAYGIFGRQEYAELVVTDYWESREMVKRVRGIARFTLIWLSISREESRV